MASGEGYGIFILSTKARCAVGIELDHAAIVHASETYKKENLRFIEGSISDVPVKGEKIFDLIVCFEAIEHICEHENLFNEIKRLMAEDGILIISTPNKRAYSDEPGYLNPFHKKELYFSEFCEILASNFSDVLIFGQKVFCGSSIYQLSPEEYSVYHEVLVDWKDNTFAFKSEGEKVPLYLMIGRKKRETCIGEEKAHLRCSAADEHNRAQLRE